MEKMIGIKKSVADSPYPDLPLELAVHKTSYLLTELFLGEGQPFRTLLKEKVCDEDMDNKRIRFDAGGYARHIKDPKTGKMMVMFNVSDLWLWVCMKDHRKEVSPHDQMQSAYMQGRLEEYLYGKGIKMPSHNPEETENLLIFLAQHIPSVWDYFTVIKVKE